MVEEKFVFTCIVCPRACEVAVLAEGKNIVEMTGYSCPRGQKYVSEEFLAPKRVLTTTVETTDGRMLPVKTSKPIPKEKQAELAREAGKVKAKTPVNVGDVVIQNIAGTGADVVATKKLE